MSFSNLIRVLIGRKQQNKYTYRHPRCKPLKIGISLDIVSLVVNYLAVEPKPL